MRITTSTLSEFIQCLDAEKSIYDNTVRVSISKRPVDGNRFTSTKFEVVLQAGVVVEKEDNSQYLLEYGETVGIDYEDASQERPGTITAEENKRALEEYVVSRGWKVLPGQIQQ